MVNSNLINHLIDTPALKRFFYPWQGDDKVEADLAQKLHDLDEVTT